ncbi:MAG: nucleotidyltransferase family protein, partial [Vicinamibacterales bacterium]
VYDARRTAEARLHVHLRAAPAIVEANRRASMPPRTMLPAATVETVKRIAVSRGARNVRVFGSVARGESRTESDLDLLVDMERGRTLLDLVGLWQDLEEALGKRIDVVSEGGLSPHLRDRILSEAVPL